MRKHRKAPLLVPPQSQSHLRTLSSRTSSNPRWPLRKKKQKCCSRWMGARRIMGKQGVDVGIGDGEEGS
jgi:hypothetical protein